MPNFIFEDDLEKALARKLTTAYGWKAYDCFTAVREDLNDGKFLESHDG